MVNFVNFFIYLDVDKSMLYLFCDYKPFGKSGMYYEFSQMLKNDQTLTIRLV